MTLKFDVCDTDMLPVSQLINRWHRELTSERQPVPITNQDFIAIAAQHGVDLRGAVVTRIDHNPEGTPIHEGNAVDITIEFRSTE